MANILHIISSPRTGVSVSTKLGNAIVEKLVAAMPSSEVLVHDLTIDSFPHLQQKHLNAFFTRPGERTAVNLEDISDSENAIREIGQADIIVISVPVYNFHIHSTLKAWIDQIVRSGITFTYDETGTKGLLNGKKVYLAVASKGVYSKGPLQPFDFAVSYLKFVLKFIGIDDVEVVRVEGSSVAAEQQLLLEEVMKGFVVNPEINSLSGNLQAH